MQDIENEGWQKQGPVQSGVPRHWGSVRCGCIEGVLATAILAGKHPDVWDAAGLLLREHHKCVLNSVKLFAARPQHVPTLLSAENMSLQK